MTFPQDIKKHRQAAREKLTQEQRQVAALEDIADVLESIRVILLSQANKPDRISGFGPRT